MEIFFAYRELIYTALPVKNTTPKNDTLSDSSIRLRLRRFLFLQEILKLRTVFFREGLVPSLDYGYVLFKKGQNVAYGAVWCEDCHHALSLSRASIRNDEKVLPKLPNNLIYA